MRWMSSLYSSAGHQDTNIVAVGEDAFAQFLNLFLIAQVCCVNENLSTKLLDRRLRLEVYFISLDGVSQSSELHRHGALT
jgi:hypothetical protein